MRKAVLLCIGLLFGALVWGQTAPPTYDFVKNGVQSASVDNSTGVPRLMINGQPVPPLLFFFNTGIPDAVIAAGVKGDQYLAPQMKDANAAGIHIFSMSFDRWPWDAGSAANPPDFSASDQELTQLLKVDPQAVFLLRIPVAPPGNWSGWATYAQWGKNEDNLYLDGTSSLISIASNVYLQGFIAGVNLMVQHYESSAFAPHILGYHITGQNTGEWFPANYSMKGLDYSPASTTAFRSWLLQKYGTDQTLSKAWGASATIASAPIPVPAPGTFPITGAAAGTAIQEFYSLPSEQNMVDYSDYISDEVSSRVLAMAHAVRVATAGKRLVAFFHGYIYDLAGSMTGHLRMNRILASPDIDIVAAPISYITLEDRLAGGAGGSMSARDSVTLHGKLWMNEDDLFTYLCADLPNPNYNGNRPTADVFETYNVLLRNLASTMIHRGGTWWMDLNATGCFNDPALWNVMSTYGLPLYNEIYAKPTPYRPEVAVITDDRSVIYQKSAWDFLLTSRTFLRNAIAKTGASVGYYDLSDFISGLLPPTKVYIFANAFSLSDSQVTAIRARLKSEGATAIWQYAPGYIGPNGPDISQSQTLTGIQLAVDGGYSGSTGDSLMGNMNWGWAWGTPTVVLSPRLIVTDPNVTRLGHYWSDSAVSTAFERTNGFNSVFVGDVGWNPQMLTQLLTAAGVHIWTTGNDVIHTDGSYLVVHAGIAGQQHISLPVGVAASDLSGTLLATNPQLLPVTFSAVGETKWFRLSPASQTPVGGLSITTSATLPEGTVGAPYAQRLVVTGGVAPYTWSVSPGTFSLPSALPAGLTLSLTGSISGMPTTVGASSFTVTVTDAGSNTVTQSFNFAVNASFAIATPPTLLAGVAGAPYSQTLTAVNGTATYSWSSSTGELPAGLTLSQAGIISGSPPAAGTLTFTLLATDARGLKASQTFNIAIVNGTSYVLNAFAAMPPGFGDGGLAFDGAGNLYVGGVGAQIVQEVLANGSQRAFAGTGTAGYSGDGGPATAAQLDYPRGIVVDSSGDVYIADPGNNRLRVVTPDGIIQTFAGTGSGGLGDGGAPTAASLSPYGVALDSVGNVYIADTGNNRIRLVSNGIISTIVGLNPGPGSDDGGPAANARLNVPVDLALDAQGNLYIADRSNNRICKVIPTNSPDLTKAYQSGTITTIVGSGIAGAGPNQLNQPQGVAVDGAGNVYIADNANSRILELTASGNLVRIAGTGTSGSSGNGGPANNARIADPTGIKVDTSGTVYFNDANRGGVVVLQPTAQTSTPVISLVANAEGGAPLIAPNTWVEIKGTSLAPAGDARIWQASDFVNNQMPTQLDGVSVTVNGKNAYVYYISGTQVNILTPPDSMQGSVQVKLTNGAATNTASAEATQASPSFFVLNGGYVVAEHANGSLVGPSSLYPGSTTPAIPGETIVLFANGFGPTSAPVVSGSPAQTGSLPAEPIVTIGGVQAMVQFAGLVSPGEFQFNVVVPSSTPDGNATLTATYNGLSTQTGVLLAVQH
jgi:uncharacterized protein (TIGR03437 family)